ncbi:hypothetical protein [Streptomyces sp. NBC_01233]|uniref:hypothetical protein n=1 Tax=Streptomyces sp. NBC_01233 TaxID=2903787 RepID=UPI002E144C98|nr:hypothetical protein OG332_19440 [Streptomyces sp. NBC_01233]
MHWNAVARNRPQEQDAVPAVPAAPAAPAVPAVPEAPAAPAARSKWPRRVLAVGTTVLSSLAGKVLADLLQDVTGP